MNTEQQQRVVIRALIDRCVNLEITGAEANSKLGEYVQELTELSRKNEALKTRLGASETQCTRLRGELHGVRVPPLPSTTIEPSP